MYTNKNTGMRGNISLNKIIIRQFCSMMILIFFASVVTIPVMAEEDIKVVLNGTELTFDVPPQMIKDRTMVPVRRIFEAMGADVYWNIFEEGFVDGDSPIQMITAVKNEIKVVMVVDQNDMVKFVGYVADEFADFFNKVKRIELDVSPRLIDEKTLVPVRAVSDAFGIDVDWDNDARTVILTCDEAFVENKNTDKDFHGGLIDFFNKMIAGEFADTQSTDVTEITISTPEEFVAALGSNRKILLQPGVYNLSSVMQEYSSKNRNVSWKEVYDGNELLLNEIRNLTIEGIGEEPSEIVVEPRGVYVLNFINSSNMSISNIKAGHTEGGYCLGGVFSFDNCSNIEIDDTHMYGCGTVGLNLENVSNMAVTNSTIYECTYYIMTVEDCENISFDNCLFKDNEMFDLVNISNTSGLSINNSEFRDNIAKSNSSSEYAMFSVSSSENISVTNTKFINNTAWVLSDTDSILFENNILENNDFTNISHPRYSYPAVENLSNNELSAYGIRLYMTVEEVVALNGKPLSERLGRFRNHYPFTDSQIIYDYGKYLVIFSGDTVIAILISDNEYVTSRDVKFGDNHDTVMRKYGYVSFNEIWRSLSYTVPYKEGEFTTHCIDFTFDDENKLVEIMIREIGC